MAQWPVPGVFTMQGQITMSKGGIIRLIGWQDVQSHPNIYELVDLFRSEQVATEVTLRQLEAG